MKNKQAFTLIELLVVVLIIGILAAVAVPQYQKAVEKSRTAEGLAIINAIARAEERYYLANGMYSTDLTLLDIEIPGESLEYTADGTAQGIKSKYFECRGPNNATNPTSGVLTGVIGVCNRTPRATQYALMQLDNGKIACRYYSALGEQICKNYGTRSPQDSTLFL